MVAVCGTDAGQEALAAQTNLVSSAHVLLEAPVGGAHGPALAALVAFESRQMSARHTRERAVHSY